MRVLLAGGAGFIGSHVIDALLDRGDHVVCLDNLVTGRHINIRQHENHERFSFINHDVSKPFPQDQILDAPFDAVLNLASPASPSDFTRIPLEILAVGSEGTRNLLNLAVRDRARFLLASTSEVYGDPLISPQPETYWGNVSSTGPRSCYDEAKRFAEALTVAYRRVYGLNTCITRIFNTYGERMRPDDGRVVSTFVVQALRGEAITVHGSGHQGRSFCYVADLVRGILSLLASDHSGPLNLGHPVEMPVIQLANQIVELTSSSSSILMVPMPPEREGDPMQRNPDISLARSVLNWEPSVDIAEGLTRMIEYFRSSESLHHQSPSSSVRQSQGDGISS